MGIQFPTEHETRQLMKEFGSINFGFQPKFKYSGILDVFDRCLSEEEARILLSSFEDHNLKHEHKFLRFFHLIAEEAYLVNPVFAYIQVGFDYPSNGRNNKYLKASLKTFEQKDIDVIMKILNTGYHAKRLIKADNYASLKLLVSLSTRELCFSNFYLLNFSTLIMGNYDLSFPILCREEKVFNHFKSVARMVNLFIR